MEANKMRALVLVFILMSGVLIQETTARSKAKCYVLCMIECLILWHRGLVGCSGSCGDQCDNLPASATPSDHCLLGCATTLCAQDISMSANPSTAGKAEKCVEGCEISCGNEYKHE